VSTETDKKGKAATENSSRKSHTWRIVIVAAVAIGVAVVALGAIFLLSDTGGRPSDRSSDDGPAGNYAYQVGNPGPGEEAPPIKLPSTDGSTFDLASLRGQTVLLYFQEGVMCQPCWDQLKDMEAQSDEFKALGIDKTVSITNDPLDALKQKVGDEGISTPLLSDPGLVVSKTYDANSYGMMGKSRNGHTFIVVGPDGKIRWRADYGGAPDYTMYVPVPNLLADMRAGLQKGSS
jgi:peroxiredoxin Q/BCP